MACRLPSNCLNDDDDSDGSLCREARGFMRTRSCSLTKYDEHSGQFAMLDNLGTLQESGQSLEICVGAKYLNRQLALVKFGTLPGLCFNWWIPGFSLQVTYIFLQLFLASFQVQIIYLLYVSFFTIEPTEPTTNLNLILYNQSVIPNYATELSY